MGLGETGDWQGAAERIVGLVKTGADPLGGVLPEGYGSQRLLEAFAREVQAEHGTDLGMSLPVTLGAYSAAMQGGFLAPVLRRWKPPQYLWVSTVVQFLGIASAGQQKSTLLNEVTGPLKAALDGAGAEHRKELVDKYRDAASKKHGDEGVAVTNHAEDWIRVYNGGLCPSSYTDQGTPEGIRAMMAHNGGHRAVLTAEPDILRDVGAYTQGKGGSLRHLLSGWDQEEIAADRVSGGVNAIEPSLPCVIMLQPESFVKYTTGGPDGSDDFVDRGVFSRMLLWQADNVAVPLDFPDLEDWDPEHWDPDAGSMPMLEVLRGKLGESMSAAVARSNPYRVSKGILHAYLDKPPGWPMPRPAVGTRVKLALDGPEGHRAAARVQQLRTVLIGAVEAVAAERPDWGVVLYPFAQRFTSHVMRMAAVLSVADHPWTEVVDTGHIEDVATRLMPWLWAGWWRIMADRLESNQAALVEANALKNTKGLSLSGEQRVLEAFVKLEKKLGIEAMGGFPQGAVIKQAKLAFTKLERSKVHTRLEGEFAALLAEGALEIAPVLGTPSASGKVTPHYRITDKGRSMLGL